MLGELWERVWLEPASDEVRRVLADALLEAGDPRGEFIAVQCRLAAVEPDERGPELKALEVRERELLEAHQAEWVGEWPFAQPPDFVRGFPERQRAPVTEMVRHFGRARQSAPTLDELAFTDEEPRAWTAGFRMFAEAHRSVRRLTLPVTFSPADMAPLRTLAVDSLAFTGGLIGTFELPVKELALEFDVGLRELHPLPSLRVLINRGNELREVPDYPDLERLTLDRVRTRVAPARYRKLRRLELLDTALERRGVQALLEAGHPAVTRLGFRGEKLDPDLVALLERWPSLEVLDVRGCTVPPRALDAPAVQRLRCLLR